MALSCCKKLFALLKGITSNHKGNVYCLNCLQPYHTENKLKKHKHKCKNHSYCDIEIPKEDNKEFKHSHGETSMKVPLIIYADFESLLEKMSICHNSLKKSSTTKITKHLASGYSLFTHYLVGTTKNKLVCYRGKDCMKRFGKDLKKHATKIINYEKRKMIPLTNEEKKYITIKKFVIYAKKDLVLTMKIKNTIK